MQVTDRRLIALLPRNPGCIRVIFRVPKSVVVIYLQSIDLPLHQCPIEEYVVIQCEDVFEPGKKGAAGGILLRFYIVRAVWMAFGDGCDKRILDCCGIVSEAAGEGHSAWSVSATTATCRAMCSC